MKSIRYFALLVALLIGAGCNTISHELEMGEVVGGGVYIYWEAPAKGTVFLVETTTDTLIWTESVSEGEVFMFDAADEPEQVLLKTAIPREKERINIVLRFLPSGTAD